MGRGVYFSAFGYPRVGKKMEDGGKKIESEVDAKIIVWGKIKEI